MFPTLIVLPSRRVRTTTLKADAPGYAVAMSYLSVQVPWKLASTAFAWPGV